MPGWSVRADPAHGRKEVLCTIAVGWGGEARVPSYASSDATAAYTMHLLRDSRRNGQRRGTLSTL